MLVEYIKRKHPVDHRRSVGRLVSRGAGERQGVWVTSRETLLRRSCATSIVASAVPTSVSRTVMVVVACYLVVVTSGPRLPERQLGGHGALFLCSDYLKEQKQYLIYYYILGLLSIVWT